MTEICASQRERFYRERDSRTESYLNSGSPASVPVSIHASADVCESKSGQLLLVTLVNQLARIHRELRLVLGVPHAELQIPPLCAGGSLGDEVQRLARRIDPYGRCDVDCQDRGPATISIGAGAYCRPDLAWYLSWNSSNAELKKEPSPIRRESSGALRGAGLAALLGAAAATKAAAGIGTTATTISAWNLSSGVDADPGPEELPEIDIGRGLMVGAGAVATAVVYWLMQWGNHSAWTVIDRDTVALDNTNRSLLFFPEDAGWPGTAGQAKVDCLHRYLVEVEPVRAWYDEAPETRRIFDTVLVLANERDVRTRVSSRNDPIQLQATTGKSWLSQLHRHIAGRDDCVRCRMADIKAPQLRCSEATMGGGNARTPGADAALPFLSAASGLMLVSILQRLQLGEFGTEKTNIWNWDFRNARRMHSSGYCECRSDCSAVLGPDSRRRIAGMTCWSDASWVWADRGAER